MVRQPDNLPSPKARLILTMGILSCGCLGFGPLGIATWVMANKALKEIRAGRMDSAGEDLIHIGRFCGVLGTLFMVFMLLQLITLVFIYFLATGKVVLGE